jgi:hypothetical protein
VSGARPGRTDGKRTPSPGRAFLAAVEGGSASGRDRETIGSFQSDRPCGVPAQRCRATARGGQHRVALAAGQRALALFERHEGRNHPSSPPSTPPAARATRARAPARPTSRVCDDARWKLGRFVRALHTVRPIDRKLIARTSMTLRRSRWHGRCLGRPRHHATPSWRLASPTRLCRREIRKQSFTCKRRCAWATNART